MKNLFEKGSIDDTAMKSRDKKRAMFVKVITLLELVSKKELGIEVDKILAGQESDKTNLMLQIVGRLAAKSDCVANNAKYEKAVNKKIGSGGAEVKNSGTEVEKSAKVQKEAPKETAKAKEPPKRSRTTKPEIIDPKKSKTRQNSKSPTKTRERSKSPQKAQVQN